jgi:lipopolysaccharide heptosyltransferase II
MKKILVIQTAFLGDVILATAVVENLHFAFPQAAISILVREGNESLLKNHPFLNKVFVWKKKNGKIRNLISTIKIIRAEKFDAVINLQRFISSGLITAFSGSKIRAGFDKNPISFAFTNVTKHIIGDGRHETDRNLQVAEFLCESKIRRPRLYPTSADDQKTLEYKIKPYVTIAPASVWFTKQLPQNKWVELIQKIPDNLNIYLLGAPSDNKLCEQIITLANTTNTFNLAGTLNLLQTASLMRESKMNYVNDSGPLHIASAMNAPTTAFFCSTIPAFGFGPLADNAKIIETKTKLTCRPCGLHGNATCPEQHFKCATTIEIPTITFA